MNRLTKQVVYGIFYGVFWFTVIYGGYRLTLSPPATCTDGVKNQDEVEIDCGGPFCQSCEIKHLLPIEFAQVQLMPNAQGTGTTAVVEIHNPNAAYGTPRLQYKVSFYGGGGEVLYEVDDATLVYPSEVKYRLVVNVPVEFGAVVRATATPTVAYTWSSITEFARPKTLLREVHVEYQAATGRAVITGLVKNDNPFSLRRVTLSALLSDREGVLLAASKTIVQDLLAAEERFFQIDTPLPAGAAADTFTDPRVIVDVER